MALIRTIADARKYVRLSQLADTSSLPDVEAVELLHLVPLIGQALYDKLNTDYTTLVEAPINSTDKYVLSFRYAQRMIAPLSYALELGTYQSLITDAGVRTLESDKMQAAHSWEFKQLKTDLLNKSAQGMELLLRYLVGNASIISEYSSSDEYKQYNELAIKSATDFTRYYRLYDPFRSYHLLRPIISDVQERYIVPIIGREMLKWMKDRKDAKITVDNVEIDMMMAFKKSIVCFTLKHAISQLSVRFSDAGFTILSSGSNEEEAISGRTDATALKLTMQLKELETEGQNWLKDLERYMTGAYNGEFANDFDDSFDTAFLLGPLAPSDAASPTLISNNKCRKIYVLGGR
jgi:hypothetical protein